MTKLTNVNMKTIITTVITTLLISFIFTGCNKDNYVTKCLNPNDPACNTQQEVTITPSRSLGNVLGLMDKDLVINKMTVIDGSNRELVFKLVPSSNKPDEILAQYELAYKNNYELLKKLLPNNQGNAESQAATEQELAELSALYETPRTVDTIMLSSINVSGPAETIAKFKALMEE